MNMDDDPHSRNPAYVLAFTCQLEMVVPARIEHEKIMKDRSKTMSQSLYYHGNMVTPVVN